MRQRVITLLTITWLSSGLISAHAGRGEGATPTATLKAVTVSGPSSGNELLLRLDGQYTYRTVQASDNTIFVDLQGTTADGVAKNGQWSNGLITGYQILQSNDQTAQPMVRVQVELKHSEPFRVQQDHAGLRLVFGPNPATNFASDTAQSTRPDSSAGESVVPVAKSASIASARRPAEVSGVAIRSATAEGVSFDVATTRPTAYHVLRLKNPERLVVDLEQARKTSRQRIYPVESPLVKDVRVGQFRDEDPAVVRVVADLIGEPAFDVHPYKGGVRIELRSRNSAAAPATPTALTKAVPPDAASLSVATAEEKPAQMDLTKSSWRSPSQSDEPAKLSLEPKQVSQKAKDVKSATPAIPASEYQNVLPALAGSKEGAAAPRPMPSAQTPEILQAAKAAKILAGSTNTDTSTNASTDTAVSQGPPTAAGAEPPQEKPKYTGEPISLNLKDLDLKDFFRLVHEISGLNIIIDPNVSGSVTMVLDAVPWDQALDIVLKNNRLDKTLEGNVLRIAKVETLSSEQEAAAKLVVAREQAQPLVTIFRPVNYAKATTIQTMLKSWAGGGALSSRGTILVDDRTNTLIIADIQSQIPVIESIITKLDKKAKQVVIEARIVLATASFTRSLQAALSGGTVNRSTSVVTGGTTGTGASVTANIVPPPRITIGQTSATGFGAYAVSNASAKYFLNAAIAAAETKSLAKTISRPTIVTQNNVPGTVQQGAQIPIQTTINNTISIQYIAATLQLTVTPQVTQDGNIFLQIMVNNASPGPALTFAGPSINTQQASTQVLVPDGGTVVFGGVTVSSRSRSATYVPLIGSIPILGHLFKQSNLQDNDNELLFFVSPKVLEG